jgi:DNA-binding winged helix-turn-helix (wHTH) protein
MATSSFSQGCARFGQFHIDLGSGELFRSGQPVHLQDQPFQILRLLLEAEGKVVTREQLCATLWPADTFVDFELGLNTAVKKLRQALEDPAEHSRFIETLPKRGYRFMAPMEWVTETREKEALHLVVPAVRPETEPPDSTELEDQTRPGTGAWNIGAMASLVGLLIVVVSGSWSVYRWRTHASQAVNHEPMDIRKLADTSFVDQIAISPDGRYVVYARRMGEKSSLRMRQLESGGDVEVLSPDDTDFVGLTFSPDGSYLYFVRSEKEDHGLKHLYVMPALGGPSRKLIADIDSPVSFAPGGRQFVFTRGFPMKNEIEVRVANPDGTGEHLLTTIKGSAAGFQPGATWSPMARRSRFR